MYNNKSLIAQTVTNRELPKHQTEKNTTYQIDSLKKELNKKLIAKADTLVDKTLSCTRIKSSKLQTLILDGVESGVLVSDFAQQFRRENADVPDLYFTLLVAAGILPTLVLDKNATAEERVSWVSSKL